MLSTSLLLSRDSLRGVKLLHWIYHVQDSALMIPSSYFGAHSSRYGPLMNSVVTPLLQHIAKADAEKQRELTTCLRA